AQIGQAFAPVPSVRQWVEAPSAVRVGAIEIGEPMIGDSYSDVGDDERHPQPEYDQRQRAQQPSHRMISVAPRPVAQFRLRLVSCQHDARKLAAGTTYKDSRKVR